MPEFFFSEYGIKIFVSLLVLGSLVVFFNRQSRDLANADLKSVINLLNKLGSGYEVVTNIVVPGDHGVFDVGNIVVSPYGIFVITVRQTVGKIFGKKGDREWEVRTGRSRGFISNPLWENRKHVNALENIIGTAPFISVVVFPRAKLEGDFVNNVIRLEKLKKFISQNKISRLSMDKRDEILSAMRKG